MCAFVWEIFIKFSIGLYKFQLYFKISFKKFFFPYPKPALETQAKVHFKNPYYDEYQDQNVLLYCALYYIHHLCLIYNNSHILWIQLKVGEFIYGIGYPSTISTFILAGTLFKFNFHLVSQYNTEYSYVLQSTNPHELNPCCILSYEMILSENGSIYTTC